MRKLQEMTLDELKTALAEAQKRVEEYDQLGKYIACRWWVFMVSDINEEIESRSEAK